MEKNWVVYILECADGTLYTGITDCFVRRFQNHAAGKGAKYTRGRGPLKVRYLEPCADRSSALRREWVIKKLPRKEKLLLCQKSPLCLQDMLPEDAGSGILL